MMRHKSDKFCPECYHTKLELAKGTLSNDIKHLLVCPNCFFRFWVIPTVAEKCD